MILFKNWKRIKTEKKYGKKGKKTKEKISMKGKPRETHRKLHFERLKRFESVSLCDGCLFVYFDRHNQGSLFHSHLIASCSALRKVSLP